MILHNKVAIVTGATNGIGEVAAQELAAHGAEVVIISRNKTKLDSTVARIITATGNPNVSAIQADLSDMAQVRRAAKTFLETHQRLDILINNAGAVFENRLESVDGYEMTLALNHLNYFLLTHCLLDTLKQTAKMHGEARIVNVSSAAHYSGVVNFNDIHAIEKYSRFQRYSDSKLMNVLFTYELANRLEGTGISTNTLHPGFINTGFGMNMSILWKSIINLAQIVLGKSPVKGAETYIYLATSPEVKGITGKYWEKKQQTLSSDNSYDEALQQKLWQLSEQLVGITSVEPIT